MIKTKQESRITPFAERVYAVVAKIPEGSTMTYAQVAAAIGNPRAVRAVGNALNRNPYAPTIPCHRVVRTDGSPGGFAHGTRRKVQLLKKEGVAFS